MRRATLRSVTGRLGMALYAIWVALALVTQDVMPCPTHDGPAAAAVMMAMMPAMQMDGATNHGTRASARSRDATHASRDASRGTHHGHTCTCVGCGCCVAALDALGAPPVVVPAPAAIARGTASPLAQRRVYLPRAGRRLPFANAPPVMVSSAV